MKTSTTAAFATLAAAALLLTGCSNDSTDTAGPKTTTGPAATSSGPVASAPTSWPASLAGKRLKVCRDWTPFMEQARKNGESMDPAKFLAWLEQSPEWKTASEQDRAATKLGTEDAAKGKCVG